MAATHTAKQGEAKVSKHVFCVVHGRNGTSARVLQVSVIRNRNGAPSPRGCGVSGLTTNASSKSVRPPNLTSLGPPKPFPVLFPSSFCLKMGFQL